MKIIIIGCGKVGVALTEELSQENHDVTIIDISAKKLQDNRDNLDALQIVGNGSSVTTLMEAGVEQADIVIAVTGSDELNLLCCLLAKQNGNCATVARVRNPVYNKEINFLRNSLGISLIINPELSTASEIARLLRFPSAIKIDPFAKGKVELLKFRMRPEFKLDGNTVKSLVGNGKFDILVAGVERGDDVYIPNGDFILRSGDLVSILAIPQVAANFFKSIGLKTNQVKNCLIVGGGTVAVYLSRLLAENKIPVTIIERSLERCEQLVTMVPNATIIHGDGTSKDVLEEEHIENKEAFVSLTNMDEENIMLGLYAAKTTNAKVVTKINRQSFDSITDELELGSVIHPKYITTDRILQFTRATQNSIGSNVETLYHILDNKAEALEFRINDNSSVVGVSLKDLKLKNNLLIGCINREGKVWIPRGNDSLQVGDTVVVVTSQRQLRDIQDILDR